MKIPDNIAEEMPNLLIWK